MNSFSFLEALGFFPKLVRGSTSSAMMANVPLIDLGVFTLDPGGWQIVFSQHAISGERGMQGELRYYGAQLLPPQSQESLPGPGYVA